MLRHIPESFIDELITRVDIVDVIDPHVPLQNAGRDFKGLCPFHQEKTPSFTVSREKQFYHCFGCGSHGTAIGFLMQFSNLGFVEAVAELAALTGMAIPQQDGGAQAAEPNGLLFTLHEAAAKYFAQQLRVHPNAGQAVNYLKSRGLSGEAARDFGIGYAPPGWNGLIAALAPDSDRLNGLVQAGLAIRKNDRQCYDRFRDRIMFPIHDQRGRIVGFGGRVIEHGEPKYLNSPETPIFHKGRELYHLYRARQPARDAQRILVVEGYMDVVALVQFGVQNVVATLGTATTLDHLERLFRTAPEISFCFDGDAAGRRAAWRALTVALPLLREGRYVSFLFLPAGEDPDTLVRKTGPEQFRAKSAYIPLSDFLFSHIREDVDLNDLDGRARLLDRARPLIEKLPAGAYRRLLEERLAQLTQLPAGDVATLMGGERDQPVQQRAMSGTAARSAPSLVRAGVSLLLRKPELAIQAGDPCWLREIGLPGAGLLADLIEIASHNGDLSSAALIERFRGLPAGEHLAKLLATELPIPPSAFEQEFQGVIDRLRLLDRRKSAAPIEKTPPSKLSEQDKQAIRRQLAELANRP